MGTISATLPNQRTSIAEALFSSSRARVLALLFGQPHRSFFANEIIRRAGAGSGAVQRELKKLESSGLATVKRIGNQKHYQANPEAPIYSELCSLIRKTMGLAEPLREALHAAWPRIDLALVYGSVAAGTATASSDIDLLLVSDDLTLEEVYELLQPAETTLDRTISPVLYTAQEFRQRLEIDSPFLRRVLEREVLLLKGSLPDAP